jgi:hypothetical protein
MLCFSFSFIANSSFIRRLLCLFFAFALSSFNFRFAFALFSLRVAFAFFHVLCCRLTFALALRLLTLCLHSASLFLYDRFTFGFGFCSTFFASAFALHCSISSFHLTLSRITFLLLQRRCTPIRPRAARRSATTRRCPSSLTHLLFHLSHYTPSAF